MKRLAIKRFFGAIVAVLSASGALAHARLDHANPGVDATVSSAPTEIAISFSEPIVAGFSGAKITGPDGAGVKLGKTAIDPNDRRTMHMAFEQPLKPGAYVVEWHAVSIDTHRSSGSYRFVIAP